jgi:hypothetical protein
LKKPFDSFVEIGKGSKWLPQLISLRTFGVREVLGYGEEKEGIIQLIQVVNDNYQLIKVAVY